MHQAYWWASVLSLALMSACGGSSDEQQVKRKPAAYSAAPSELVDPDGLYRFFAVAFGAAPGTVYMSQMKEAVASGASLRGIVNVFTTKPQFLARYPASLSNQSFAETLVRNIVMGSASEAAQQAAMADVRAALDVAGASRGDVIYAIVSNLAAKPNDDPLWAGTAQLLRNQVTYARHFTESMQSPSTDLPTLQKVLAWINRASSTQGDLTVTLEEAIKPTRLVLPAPTMLPDLREKFKALCGVQANWHIQSGSAVNLSGHRDGRKDILLALWCGGIHAPGVSNLSPVKNTLVALLQNPDGSFRDGTTELFGSNSPDIGGIPHYAAHGDYNGDGRDDIVFSVSREDGRDWSIDHALNGVQPAFVTSGPGGRYRVERLGTPEWGYAAMNLDNELGGQDVLVGGEIYDVWRHAGSGWTVVANYSAWATPRTYFLPRTAPGLASERAIVGENSGKQLSLYQRTGSSHQWSMTGFYSVATPNPPKAVFVAWNGQVGEQTITSLEGRDYTSVYFDGVCALRLRPGSAPVALSVFAGMEVMGGYQGQIIREGENTQSMAKLMAFSMEGGRLQKIPLSITDEVTSRYALFGEGLRCRDINGDGTDDIEVVTAGGEHAGELDPPMIYLNDGQGRFKRVARATIPRVGNLLEGAVMLYEDLDGDGIRDQVFFSAATGASKDRPMSFPMFKGQRALKAGD